MLSLFLNAAPDIREKAASQYGEKTTVQTYLYAQNAAAVACAGCNLVYLNYNFFGGGSLNDSIATIIHEAIHNFTGMTDGVIQTRLGLKVGASSQNITDEVYKKCL
jgi:hypothetical protein